MADIEQIVPHDYCVECRGCCRFLASDGPWGPKLLEHEKKSLGELTLKPSGKEKLFFCGFFRPDTNSCGVYENRPFDCRLYPFLLLRAESGAIVLCVDENCLFVQEHQHTPLFQNYWKRLKKTLESPEIASLIRNNPQIVQRYIGVLELTGIVV